ncbi:hypothetical protein BC826DRAFT_1188946 [Russula brevipes]|nr:hypothetical protein BC826DRAFT_1188946 [Russula brevipes]
MALGGGAYCVVFNTWAQTSRFLSDPFTALDSGFGVSVSPSRPALLYVLNSSGLPPPTQSVDSIGASLRQLQDRVGSLRQPLDSWANALAALALRQEQSFQQFSAISQRTAASFASLSNVVSCSAELQAANSRLRALQSDRRTSLVLLTFAPPDRTDTLTQHVQDIDAVIYAQHHTVFRAEESFAAAQQQLLSANSLLSPPAQP